MNKKIAILGSGPAGLMAARAIAVVSRERDIFPDPFEIFALGYKSPLYGAQYLHEPIPGVTPEHGEMIEYKLLGTTEDYRRRVYGDDWDGTVSPEDLDKEHWGWDLRSTYDNLWYDYGEDVNQIKVTPGFVRDLLADGWLVVSSIPAHTLCDQGHAFLAQDVIAAGDAPQLGISLPYSIPDFSVICNGETDGASWYRASNIFGHRTVEWPEGTPVPIPTASVVQKPLKTTCDCWDQRVLKIGRYGRWKKGVLTHHAYNDALRWAKEIL